MQDLAANGSAFTSLQEMIRHAEAAREITPAVRRRRCSGRSGWPPSTSPMKTSRCCRRVDGGAGRRADGADRRIGIGKTTIADLIIGLIRPREGAVLIDDVPLSALDLARWRSMIGYVPQDALLMHDSIALNVTLGNPASRRPTWTRAARGRRAGIRRRAAAGNRDGRRRARPAALRWPAATIALARALVHKPALLILDGRRRHSTAPPKRGSAKPSAGCAAA